MSDGAPNGLVYRCLTGPDDSEFCRRVTQALAEGYVLHGGPAITVKDGQPWVAQAVVWPQGLDSRAIAGF